jgi:hypothetical protein
MLLNAWARAAGLRVAVVQAPNGTPLVRKGTKQLSAVLLEAGFDAVEVAPATEDDARYAVECAGEGSHGVATLALRSVPRAEAIDVWIADSMTQKTTVRRVTMATRNTPAQSREIALRALDLLRASLLELESPPSRGGDESAAARRAEVQRTPRARKRNA